MTEAVTRPLTDAQRKARLAADLEMLLDVHGHEADSRKLALACVELISDLDDKARAQGEL